MHEDIVAFLRDQSQHWDRIMLRWYNPEYLEYLHLHPCQELYMEFEEIRLTLKDMQNIAKCTNLHIFNMGLNESSLEGMRALRSLPNLRLMVYGEGAHPLPCIEALSELPQVTLLTINPLMNDDDYNSDTYPFTPSEIDKVLVYIRDRRHTARQIHLSGSIGPLIFAELRFCTNIKSICIEDTEAMDENDLDMLFEGPALHKTVRHIRLRSAGISLETASYLAKFTNILWLEFSSFEEPTEAIAPVILANAKHLQSLHISYCYDIGDDLLDAIARCKSLQHVLLHKTGVGIDAIEAYWEQKRPNWEALRYKW